jgi:imidazolonepropionase-like amidohydrolase
VTTIFVPGGGGGNDDQLLSYKERCSSAELTCPDIFGSGALITAPGSHPIGTIWGLPADVDPAVVYDRGAIAVAPQDDIEALVDRKVAMQVDAIKIVIEDGIGPVYPMPRLSKAKVEQLVDAFHQRGLRVFAHISMASHVEDGVAGGIDGIMHSPEEPLAQETLVAMAQRGVFYVATLSLLDGMLDRSHGIVGADHEPYALAGSSQRALDSLRNYRFSPFSPDEATELEVVLSDNLRRAAAAGVPLALGTDVNNPSVFPGYSAHEELFLMVESGLTTREVLAAATGGGASFLGLQDRLGRIAPGYQADLLLLTGNPLDDILNTRSLFAVFSNGRSVEKVVSTAVTVR